MKRRGRDSNPRAREDKRFSRPPRYDHFDTSPRHFLLSLSSATMCILTKLEGSVNSFFCFFSKNFLPRKTVYFRAFRGICNKFFALIFQAEYLAFLLLYSSHILCFLTYLTLFSPINIIAHRSQSGFRDGILRSCCRW